MTAPSRRLPRSVLWALGVFAGTTVAVILSASSASASTGNDLGPADQLLPATIGAVTDTVAKPAAETKQKDLKPVTDDVPRPTLKPVTDDVPRPTLKPVTDQVLRPASKPVADQVLRPVTERVLRPANDQVVKPLAGKDTSATVTPAPRSVAHLTTAAPATAPHPADRAASKAASLSSPKAVEAAPKRLVPAEAATRLATTSARAAAVHASPTFVIPQPAGNSPAPHWPAPAAPSAPTQLLSGGSGSMIAKKFAVLGGIAPQQFAVTGLVTAADDLIGPAPGNNPGTTPD